ncbi:MAG: 4-hydroxybenzoyl-CoA reductase [Denitrovibrio sp.]|nr:MAG: 4-hydroxybenzoyl-CoA reductase [Denitrovibrio sp.]
MMNIEEYVRVSSCSEAYEILNSVNGSAILGGCGYLRMGNRAISKGIDLSLLGLNQIIETDSDIEIGAMTSLRDIETNPILKNNFNGSLCDCMENIVGIQLRSIVTIGGTVAGRYPFSDVLPVLMALGADVVLTGAGRVSLEDFMDGKHKSDVVEKIIIPKTSERVAYKSVRNSLVDYAILNCVIALSDGEYKVVVGARPQKAIRATKCEAFLKGKELTEEIAEEAAKIVADELSFGDNVRGSAEYRKAVCVTLIKRALVGGAE